MSACSRDFPSGWKPCTDRCTTASSRRIQDGVPGFIRTPVVTFEFPVLAKYKFTLGRVRPFLEGGPSFRTAGNLNSADPSHFGVNAGVGLETQWRSIRIAPKVRYTRWADDGPACGRAHTLGPTGVPGGLQLRRGLQCPSARPAHLAGGGDRSKSVGWVRIDFIYRDLPRLEHPDHDRDVSGPRAAGDQPAGGVERVAALLHRGECSLSFQALQHGSHWRLPVRSKKTRPAWAEPWEFPVLAKYRLSTGSIRPFLALGPSFRLPKEIGGSWLSNYGATVGAGVEFPLKRLPEDRTDGTLHALGAGPAAV